MDLCSYLETTTNEWSSEDEIRLEQYIGLLGVLEERQSSLLDGLTSFDFAVDVARHHPDSPAFIGLGIEARTVLSVSMESNGKGWLVKTWDAIQTAASKIYAGMMRLIGLIFQAYRDLATKLRETKRELEELNQSHRTVLTVPGPTILQFKGDVTVNLLAEGIKNNKTLTSFFTDSYVGHTRAFYQGLMKQVGGFRNAFEGEQDIENIKNVHITFRQQLLRERFLKDTTNPQFPILGDMGVVIPTVNPESFTLLRRTHSPNQAREVRLRVERPNHLADILGVALDICMEARVSDVRSREVTRLRSIALKEYDRVVKSVNWTDKTHRASVNYYLRTLNSNPLAALRQFHTHNYRACRMLLSLGDRLVREIKGDTA